MSSKKSNKAIDLNRPHSCEWCQKNFARESTLLSHSCEPRRRSQIQHTAPVKIGLAAYQQFLDSTSPRHAQSSRSYREFSASKHYSSFVKFGHWAIEQRVQEIQKYVAHMLSSQKPFDHWCNRELYQDFLTDLMVSEQPESALARSLDQIRKWSEQSGHDWQRFWLEVNSNTAVLWITEGRISPWMLYNCESAVSFLERLSEEQIHMVQKVAPLRKWKTRLIKYRSEADAIKQTLAEAGM